MAHTEARAWWADVEHLRDGYARTDEARRRADEADLAARRERRVRRDLEAELSALRSASHRRAPDAGDRAARGGPTEAGVGGAPEGGRRPVAPETVVHGAPEGARRTTAPHAPRRVSGELAARRLEHVDIPAGDAVDATARPRVKGSATPGMRMVEIRGRTVPAPSVPRSLDVDRRRPARRAVERVGPRPDRVAMWALLMCLLLILVAIGTADPAVVALPLR